MAQTLRRANCPLIQSGMNRGPLRPSLTPPARPICGRRRDSRSRQAEVAFPRRGCSPRSFMSADAQTPMIIRRVDGEDATASVRNSQAPDIRPVRADASDNLVPSRSEPVCRTDPQPLGPGPSLENAHPFRFESMPPTQVEMEREVPLSFGLEDSSNGSPSGGKADSRVGRLWPWPRQNTVGQNQNTAA